MLCLCGWLLTMSHGLHMWLLQELQSEASRLDAGLFLRWRSMRHSTMHLVWEYYNSCSCWKGAQCCCVPCSARMRQHHAVSL